MQLWLALAYDAMGRHADCIAVYKRLESSHPNKNLRKQAADLRFIAEAPKLKISQDEMVKIPLMEKDFDRYTFWAELPNVCKLHRVLKFLSNDILSR